MPDAELWKKIRRIEVYTNRLVTSVLAGGYVSVFKGRGIEFAQVREYQPGDDVRAIDWNVTARMNRPFVKEYTEERELSMLLLVDVSSSVYFGSVQQLKRELATEFCASIAFSALRHNDRVGLVLFTDRIELTLPPKKGRRHVLRLIRELLHFTPTAARTNLEVALEYACRLLSRRSTLFVVSDFLAPDFRRPLDLARARHDVIAVAISDPRERELPDVGLIELKDAETGEVVLVDTHSPVVRRAFRERAQTRQESREQLFRQARVDTINLRTDQSVVPPLLEFFRRRKRRLARI
ncbi:MAG TPA: DUF58 domain-containing protein [Armatimonadetes bacterium]|nr:DUF58 domain-containing protein [Armatimonadota bacterium]